MAWVVDTCLLIDIALADPKFAQESAALLDEKRPEGLRISPVSFVELAPVFGGDRGAQIEFLIELQIRWPESWQDIDTDAAHQAWNRYAVRKKIGITPKRPIADIFIGAFAEKHDGLLTRNPSDFRTIFPSLRILEP